MNTPDPQAESIHGGYVSEEIRKRDHAFFNPDSKVEDSYDQAAHDRSDLIDTIGEMVTEIRKRKDLEASIRLSLTALQRDADDLAMRCRRAEAEIERLKGDLPWRVKP